MRVRAAVAIKIFFIEYLLWVNPTAISRLSDTRSY
jgi:hypothetical protein